jgi:hypothetical protein
LTIKVLLFTSKPPLMMVEVEVCPEVPTVREEEAFKAPLTRNVLSKVDEALTKMPALEEVGVRVLGYNSLHAPGSPVLAPPPVSPAHMTFPDASTVNFPLFPRLLQL